MVRLSWKTALVTGSSRGIGRGVLHKLVDAGVRRVAVNYVANEAVARETAEALKGKGAEVLLIKADCTDLDQVRRMFDEVRSGFGGLDVFVHNARPNPGAEPWFASAMDLTPAGLDAAYRSQVHAMVVSCQACASLMQGGGRIIGITHAPGGRTGSWQPWAAMGGAKAALEATIRYFAVSLATRGITVNAVSPGIIDDSIINSLPTEAYHAIKDWSESGWTPMKRMGTPADVGNAVALLCAEEASFITGQILYVDGGASVMYPEIPLPIQGL
ncbi:MAG TPA: SDR family oxidoreductase [Geminicoccaceae bacterium]|nr:SDR family oxidoreductase [Geminicoccaceae bacterium]